MKFITTSHATVKDGNIYEAPANFVVETLVGFKEPFLFIRHSIDGNIDSIAYDYSESGTQTATIIFPKEKSSVIRYFKEIYFTTAYLLKRKDVSKSETIFIGVDPLNCLIGLSLQLFGKVKKIVYFTTDYSPKRFENPILNIVFKFIDWFDVLFCAEVWNVSTRISQLRLKSGVTASKVFTIPNTPADLYKKYLQNERNPHTLITLGVISDQMDFEGLIKATKELSLQFVDIKLLILGNGPKLEDYKSFSHNIGADAFVEFLGYQTHEKALEYISKSGVGIALYNGKWGFNYYGDSAKCREFLCFGLPVLTTDTHSTVEDIKEFGAGIISKVDSTAYVANLQKIFKEYGNLSQNAYKLAEKYDGVLEKNLQRTSKI